jgi:hypothetical protein
MVSMLSPLETDRPICAKEIGGHFAVLEKKITSIGQIELPM